MAFLVAFLIFFFGCGVFIFPFVFTHDKNKPLAKRFITAILATAFFAGIFGGCLFIDTTRDDNNWNDGYCPDCGTHWVFKGGTRYKFSTEYYYECENCHTVIETSHIMR